ncbi:MAG: hypothetical protein AVDCRST_MAG45-1527 [uncultured Solirubrobacterales bacterium]|uniref:Uncharacterized protein n=1 Tax=uncultured Solirubrobacterales bacterium TaxID=768556 RepID=A0A6J4ST92_9ACTN|nr:MAG: hypothetical protein AVDCRST_MAG45-1527 [uncultured Solirubrobacterales bacterium]
MSESTGCGHDVDVRPTRSEQRFGRPVDTTVRPIFDPLGKVTE